VPAEDGRLLIASSAASVVSAIAQGQENTTTITVASFSGGFRFPD